MGKDATSEKLKGSWIDKVSRNKTLRAPIFGTVLQFFS